MKVGQRVKSERVRANLSENMAAMLSSMSRKRYRDIEACAVEPTPHEVRKLAKALGVPPKRLDATPDYSELDFGSED